MFMSYELIDNHGCYWSQRSLQALLSFYEIVSTMARVLDDSITTVVGAATGLLAFILSLNLNTALTRNADGNANCLLRRRSCLWYVCLWLNHRWSGKRRGFEQIEKQHPRHPACSAAICKDLSIWCRCWFDPSAIERPWFVRQTHV